jgi:hypothetical protein
LFLERIAFSKVPERNQVAAQARFSAILASPDACSSGIDDAQMGRLVAIQALKIRTYINKNNYIHHIFILRDAIFILAYFPFSPEHQV